jgi:hypothetical protein
MDLDEISFSRFWFSFMVGQAARSGSVKIRLVHGVAH